ncbi:PEP-CTERM sorting domain-containing protein [Aeoliella sp. SH292]|uniref:PEP-CTERM sorting domain-containing protein n=1 Tax=Aeoliella sp. SH292 TaxID=3454464 RepID=UPI003F9BAD61
MNRSPVVACGLLVAVMWLSPAGGEALEFEFVAETNVGNKPESVIGDGTYLYASNMGAGSNPLAKDGNGYISRLTYDGTLVDQSFISHRGVLDGPTGMAILGERLFVADIDEVIGYDLNKVDPSKRINLSQFGVGFLNDLVVVSDRHLVVSETNTKKLFLIDTVADSATQIQLNFAISHPNGLAYDADAEQLYVAANIQHTIGASFANGEILKLDLDVANGSASLVSRASNAGLFLDGISLLGDDELIYSDWVSFSGNTGVLRRLGIDGWTPLEASNLALKGFADFHWDADHRLLAAPNLVDGRVRLLSLPVPEPSTIVLLVLSASGLGLARRSRG